MLLNKEQLRKQVIQYFRSVGSGENIVQCIKEALFLHQQFNPLYLFEVLSKGKQKITTQDWRNFLHDHHIIFSENDLRYFMKQNSYSPESTLNDFLEAMIPYNADVVREYKQRHVDSLDIQEFNPEVQFIFTELIDNELKFYRSLISIRSDITQIATRKQIESLVKEDLVFKSKIRASGKFKEAFEARNFELTYHQLRKFLQLFLSSKEIIHEFYLLNVLRHLKLSNPFQKIVFKNRRGKSKKNGSSSVSKRPLSAKHPQNQQSEKVLTNQKLRQKMGQDYDKKYDTYNAGFFSGTKQDKYSDYRNEVMDEFAKEKQFNMPNANGHNGKKQNNPHNYRSGDLSNQNPLDRSQNGREEKSRTPTKNPHHAEQPRAQEKPERANEQLRRSRYERESKGIDGSLLIQMLEEMVIKEERLEKLRKNLARSADFNLINLFKLMDDHNKGFISSKDIADYTTSSKVQFNHMVEFYAREYEKLRFHEFCLIFRPLSKQLNELIDSRQENKLPNPFKGQTNKLILQVLNLTADMHSRLSSIRQKMGSMGVNLRNYFRFIDLQDKGYISSSCLQGVLGENNINCDDKDMKCLMKLFRKKVDERISLEQFVQFLQA